MGAHQPEGAPGEVQGAPAALRGIGVAGIPEAQRDQRDLHSARRSPRRSGDRMQELAQGIRRSPADRFLELQPAAGRHRRHHRAERRRQDHAVSHAVRRREARWRRDPLGPSVKLAYVDQSRQALNDKNTVWQEISGGLDLIKVGNYETSSRGYVGRFNFKGVQQQQMIGDLSGGERNRVHLAKVLKAGGNVLLLDEPTNDLDIETLRALEDAWWPFRAAPWSSRTIAGSSIASPPTYLAFEGDSRLFGSRATIRNTSRTTSAQGRGRRPAAPDSLQATDGLRS
jgi:hypothetical protein